MTIENEFATEKVFIVTANGTTSGPHACSIGDKIVFFDCTLDLKTSDVLFRPVPTPASSKAERYDIVDIGNSEGFGPFPPSLDVKVRKHPGFVAYPPPNAKATLNPNGPVQPLKPFDVFLSYSHDDEDLMDFVRKHLAVHERLGTIRKLWDRILVPGTHIDEDLSKYIGTSEIILLFISASFLASDYCYEKEMDQALRQQAAGASEVIPVILRPCTWQIPPLRNLLALPRDGRALSSWPNRDEAAKDIVEGVLRVVAKLQAKQQGAT